MQNIGQKMKNNKNHTISSVLFILLLIPISVYGADTQTAKGIYPNIMDMFAHFSRFNEPILRLISVCSYIIGIFIGLKGFLSLVERSKNPNISLSRPIVGIFISVFFIALPTFIESIKRFLFGGSIANCANSPMGDAIDGVSLFIAIIGYISVMRGLIGLHRSTYGENGFVDKSLIKIFGGVMCIHIKLTMIFFANTFGWDESLFVKECQVTGFPKGGATNNSNF